MNKQLCASLLVVVVAALVAFFRSDADPALLLKSINQDAYKDKVVWVVGASSGIGEFFAREVAAHGAKVVLSARRVDRLSEVAASIPGAAVVPLDMLDYATHAKAVQQVIAKHGKIDIVVLNAGRAQFALALETEYAVTESLTQLNFLSQVHLAKLVMPHFLEAKGGQFVVVSSMAGKMGIPMLSSYSASKYALHGYFDALRAEVSKLHNITVTIVCPGATVSEIQASVHSHKADKVAALGGDFGAARKMTTERCAELMAIGVSHKLPEMWISQQPGLSLPYIYQFFPRLMRTVFEQLIGPTRVTAFLNSRNKAAV